MLRENSTYEHPDLAGGLPNVLLYYKISDLPPNEIARATMMTPFETIVPLPVYGLEAGEYTFTVNSGYLGSFDIERNNSL